MPFEGKVKCPFCDHEGTDFSLLKEWSHGSQLVEMLECPSCKGVFRFYCGERKDESEELYKFRKERGEHLKNIFKGVSIEEILDRKLRDSIEHFYERLDNLFHSVSKKARKKSQALTHNMVFSEKAVFRPFPILVRIYISSEKVFYNINWRLNIGKIYTECLSMLRAVQDLEELKRTKEPGGLIVIIPRFT